MSKSITGHIVFETGNGYDYAETVSETELMYKLNRINGNTVRKDRVVLFTGSMLNARNLRDRLNDSYKAKNHTVQQATSQHNTRAKRLIESAQKAKT